MKTVFSPRPTPLPCISSTRCFPAGLQGRLSSAVPALLSCHHPPAKVQQCPQAQLSLDSSSTTLHSVLMLRDLHHPSHCLRDELQVPRLALPCTLTYPYVPSNSHQVGLACLCTVHACQLPSPILTTPLTPCQGHSATSTSPLGLLTCPNIALPP